MNISDPIEKIVAAGLDAAGIKYRHDSEGDSSGDSFGATFGLDFYLPDFDVFIEVKQLHSDRIAEQMGRVGDVIAIQGRTAAEFFAKAIQHS